MHTAIDLALTAWRRRLPRREKNPFGGSEGVLPDFFLRRRCEAAYQTIQGKEGTEVGDPPFYLIQKYGNGSPFQESGSGWPMLALARGKARRIGVSNETVVYAARVWELLRSPQCPKKAWLPRGSHKRSLYGEARCALDAFNPFDKVLSPGAWTGQALPHCPPGARVMHAAGTADGHREPVSEGGAGALTTCLGIFPLMVKRERGLDRAAFSHFSQNRSRPQRTGGEPPLMQRPSGPAGLTVPANSALLKPNKKRNSPAISCLSFPSRYNPSLLGRVRPTSRLGSTTQLCWIVAEDGSCTLAIPVRTTALPPDATRHLCGERPSANAGTTAARTSSRPSTPPRSRPGSPSR